MMPGEVPLGSSKCPPHAAPGPNQLYKVDCIKHLPTLCCTETTEERPKHSTGENSHLKYEAAIISYWTLGLSLMEAAPFINTQEKPESLSPQTVYGAFSLELHLAWPILTVTIMWQLD